jgi:hypothetical protein
MLANGMVMLLVAFHWLVALAVSGIISLVACVLSSIRRTRKTARRFCLVSMVTSLAPFVVLLMYADPISHYGRRELPIFLLLSLVPLLGSGLAVWLSRRALPEDR